MGYWWVSQGRTYKHERQFGYIWAPCHNENGKRFYYWDNVAKIEPGDIVYSYVKGKILAISTANSYAYRAPVPRDSEAQVVWLQNGWKVDLDYVDLIEPIPIDEVLAELLPLMPSSHSPLTVNGKGFNGYVFKIDEYASDFLLRDRRSDKLASYSTVAVAVAVGKELTERESLTRIRIGQAQFRSNLKIYWRSECSVSGVRNLNLLRASHIKPWSISTSADRLNVFNGLLLAPSYDAAFDNYLISFDSEGKMLVAPSLEDDLVRLGIDRSARLRRIERGHQKFLDHHRQAMQKMA